VAVRDVIDVEEGTDDEVLDGGLLMAQCVRPGHTNCRASLPGCSRRYYRTPVPVATFRRSDDLAFPDPSSAWWHS
jgi:hypothetical protein